MSSEPIGPPPKDVEGISAQENALVFRSFTSDTAFALGMHIRNRLRAVAAKPAVVNITLANSNQLLFHACSKPGTGPDNDIWVAMKRKVVLRWGCSSYLMHKKFDGNEQLFAEKYSLGPQAGEYAIYGGGVPVRIEGAEGVFAVVVVSGLAHEDVGQYLKLHPDMAHELMVPSGFKYRIVRRMERLLNNNVPLYLQTGLDKEATRNSEIVQSMMKGPLKILDRSEGVPDPEWHEIISHVHRNNKEAAQFENTTNGELTRVFKFQGFLLQIPEIDWKLMWDHTACDFTTLAWWDTVWLECYALQIAAHEIASIGAPWDEWEFPIGQGIAICRLRIDARLRALHRQNKNHTCCYALAQHKEFSKDLKEYLTKEQGAACVIHQRQKRGETLKACNYDEDVMDLLNMRQGPGGCGNMILKDKSPLRVHAVVLAALESPGSTNASTNAPRSALGNLQNNKKIKKEEGTSKENCAGATLCNDALETKQEDIKMEGA
ncbi:hypothetical protein MMC18_003197 [Xylographa bjoerkii]|nr:hypothetical protein [Xylographa bjoerkii]